MQFEGAKKFILGKLSQELPAHFTYHCFDHTTDVYNAAKNIAALENISEYDMNLLLTAALFHDSGFVSGADEHETGSCGIADRYLPDFGYDSADIESIKGMIMATRLPQTPKNHLEEIICDADLDYLGRDDFFPISDLLYEEFLSQGKVSDYDDWNRKQIGFFNHHHYFTKSSAATRDDAKEKNLDLIRKKIQIQS
jgi:uncharacterized protein